MNESFFAGVANGDDARLVFSGECESLLNSGEAAEASGEAARLKLEVVLLLLLLFMGEDSRLKLLVREPSLGEDSRLKLVLLDSRRSEPTKVESKSRVVRGAKKYKQCMKGVHHSY